MLGIGEDCAVIELGGRPVAVKVDPTVEGIHFPRGLRDASAIASKALGRCASDLAATGAEPRFVLVSLEIPRGPSRRFVLGLLRALERESRRLGARLVGGHTALGRPHARLALHVTMIGPCRGRPRSRSGARPGDVILVTGSFGGSILGRHLRPKARLRESRALLRLAFSAAIDVSDGLALDLARLAAASGVAIELEPDLIPIAPAARRLARRSGKDPLSHALGDGEDYELVLAATPGRARRALSIAHRRGFPLSFVGKCRRGRGLWIRGRDGNLHRLEPTGYVQRC